MTQELRGKETSKAWLVFGWIGLGISFIGGITILGLGIFALSMFNNGESDRYIMLYTGFAAVLLALAWLWIARSVYLRRFGWVQRILLMVGVAQTLLSLLIVSSFAIGAIV